MSRPATLFSATVAALILEELAEGKSLRLICEGRIATEFHPAVEGLGISRGTVLRWANGFDKAASDAGFPAQYAQARGIGVHLLNEDLLDIADDKTIEPDQKRHMLDTRKWQLSKMLPKHFGDKVQLTHEGEIGLRTIRREIVQPSLPGASVPLLKGPSE